MTRPDHASGTDRIAEANRTVRAERVINVQADEPMVSARPDSGSSSELISGRTRHGDPGDAVLERRGLSQPEPGQGGLRCPDGRAMYFSRAPIPVHPRPWGGEPDDAWVSANPCYRHLGLYAYKAGLLEEFARLPVGKLEAIERLEQLRVIENGRSIAVGMTTDPSIGVDTPADALKFEEHLGREPR
jgi:3-deoxy-manno-octulosonate cytidylyltransferase (CMP-KDO synthetase)